MPVKILVADDSATMRKIVEMTFAGEEAEVIGADSGDAAVQKAQEVQPDVVLADLSMAGMNGYGISLSVKNVPNLENTAVIVMASQHEAYDEAKGAETGVDDHVVKPFDSQVLIDKVGEVLKRPRMIPQVDAPAPAAAAAPPAAPTPPKPRPKSAPKHTVAFGAKPPAPPAPPPVPNKGQERPVLELAEEPAAPTPAAPTPARPAPRAPAAAKPTPVATAAAAATGNGSDLAAKLSGLGLDKNQVEGVLALSREVVEQVVWEVVPELAETIIREEIRRLTSE